MRPRVRLPRDLIIDPNSLREKDSVKPALEASMQKSRSCFKPVRKIFQSEGAVQELHKHRKPVVLVVVVVAKASVWPRHQFGQGITFPWALPGEALGTSRPQDVAAREKYCSSRNQGHTEDGIFRLYAKCYMIHVEVYKLSCFEMGYM